MKVQYLRKTRYAYKDCMNWLCMHERETRDRIIIMKVVQKSEGDRPICVNVCKVIAYALKSDHIHVRL